MREPLPREPRRAVLAVADGVLQRGQRRRPRLEVGEPPTRGLRGLALDTLPLLQVLDRIAQRIQARLVGRELSLFLAQLFLDVGDLSRDRGRQRGELRIEALTTLLMLGEHACHVLAPRLDHADRLFDQSDLLLRVVGEPRRLGDRGLERGQRVHGARFLRGCGLAGRQRRLERALRRRLIPGERGFLPRERLDLRGQLRDFAGDPRFGFAREGELLLQPRDLGIGGVEAALLLVQRVACGVVLGAQRLLLRFRRAHFRLHGLRRRRPARPPRRRGARAHCRRPAASRTRGGAGRPSAAPRAPCIRPRPWPARRASRAGRPARCGCPRPVQGSRACRRAGLRFPCAAPCTSRRRRPPRGRCAALRASPR